MAIALTSNDISTRGINNTNLAQFSGRARQVVINIDDGYRPIVMDGSTVGGKFKCASVAEVDSVESSLTTKINSANSKITNLTSKITNIETAVGGSGNLDDVMTETQADAKYLGKTATAATATKLATARNIALTGDVTGSASFNGTANVNIAAKLANSGVTAGSYGPTANATPAAGATFQVPQVTVDAKGRVTSAVTRTVKIPNAPTTVSGNAGSATKLATARTFICNLESTATGSFNGTANVTLGVSGELPIARGGTGATSAANALKALGGIPLSGNRGQVKGYQDSYLTSANTISITEDSPSVIISTATGALKINVAAASGNHFDVKYIANWSDGVTSININGVDGGFGEEYVPDLSTKHSFALLIVYNGAGGTECKVIGTW